MFKKCIECGNIFFKKQNQSIKYWNIRKFCSIKCSNASKIGGTPWNKGNYSVEPELERICKLCNKKFNRRYKEAMVKFVGRKYCGNDCMLKALHNNNIGNKYASGKQSKQRKRNTNKIMKNLFRNGKIKPNFKIKPFFWSGFKFRSSWEARFARECDDLGIKWYYEKHYFCLSDGTIYIPDFWLPKERKFVEVKGYWYPHSRKKFKLFKKEYPSLNIEVISY